MKPWEDEAHKLWYNIAAATATCCLLWESYKLPTVNGMEDLYYVWLFAIYLLTVGGFEVIVHCLNLVVQLKAGSTGKSKGDTL